MNMLVDVAFVVAVTAFIRTQFNLDSWKVLAVAFVVACLFSVSPLIGGVMPAFSPWLEAVLQTFWLFVVAAGSVDTVRYFSRAAG